MPEEESSAPAPDTSPDTDGDTDRRILSPYGIASAVLGVLSIAAIALGGLIFATHRDDVGDRDYRGRVMWAAAEWTGVLINLNTENVVAGMQRLRDGTVGRLNAEFTAATEPYAKVVRQLKAHSTGQIEAVAMESARARPGSASALPAEIAARTDTVLVIATSRAENLDGQPKTVNWNLRLDVSDVNGTLLVSRVETLR